MYNFPKGNIMNKFIHLKILISLQLLVLILLIIAIIYPIESLLDPLLQKYINKTYLEEGDISNNVFLLSIIPLALLNLIALITLLFKKVWAKKTYIATSLLMIPITFFLGTTVDHAITAGLNEIMIFSSGMLVALLLYTDVYEEK